LIASSLLLCSYVDKYVVVNNEETGVAECKQEKSYSLVEADAEHDHELATAPPATDTTTDDSAQRQTLEFPDMMDPKA
jgi:hypothetical protein